MSTAEAKDLQLQFAGRVQRSGDKLNPHFIAGVDISARDQRGPATAAVVVVSYPELEVVEVQTYCGTPSMPYVPGLLSFREAPLILAACEQLNVTPNLFIVDGQGIAHPRRMGIAAHLGLFLEIPTIGCAKSLLCGEYKDPTAKAGSHSQIMFEGEQIGAAVRTRADVNPVFVSIGHKIDLESAIVWTLKCCRKYRIPEPQRYAHLAAGGNLNIKANK
jgi:deoxyribonuclease V